MSDVSKELERKLEKFDMTCRAISESRIRCEMEIEMK